MISHFYPEVAVGGFSHVDSTIEFYTRVNSLICSEMEILDFGAGRGEAADDPSPYRRSLRTLRGKVRTVIGADVDPAVERNPLIDEAVVLVPDSPLPFEDSRFDLIVSDWTLEHIREVDQVTSELARILRPGGWFCARTPNRWGYVALGARLIPHRLHDTVLTHAQPNRKACDVFPKYYKLNSARQISKAFSPLFEIFTYTVNSEPAYFGNSRLMWRLALTSFRLTPSRFGSFIHAFMRKR